MTQYTPEQPQDTSNVVQRYQWKSQALLERVSAITAQYEDQDAERRVELTIVTQERDALRTENEGLRRQLEEVSRFEEGTHVVVEEGSDTAADED